MSDADADDVAVVVHPPLAVIEKSYDFAVIAPMNVQFDTFWLPVLHAVSV